VLEPIFEREFAEHSYGFRPGRSCKQALARVQDLLKQSNIYLNPLDHLMAQAGHEMVRYADGLTTSAPVKLDRSVTWTE
jgi:retron-type reverse transcriptase